MHRSIRTLLSVLVAVVTLSYVGMMVYRYNYTPYKTETVFSTSMDDSYTAQGAFIRTEQVIPSVTGVVRYRAQGGEMVLGGTVVADIFDRQSDIDRQNRIAALEQEIANLSAAQYAVYSEINTVGAINTQIEEQVTAIAQAAAYGRLDNLNERSRSLAHNLNRRQIAVGRASDYGVRIQKLERECELLLRDAAPPSGRVVAPVTGYFSSKTDGFEELFSAADFPSLDHDAVARLIAGRLEPTGQTGVGKVVKSHNYLLALLVDDDAAGRFSPGARLEIDFPHSAASGIGAQVLRAFSLEGDRHMVYLRLSNISDYLLAQRTATVQVKFNRVTGLRLPLSALRYVGAQPGAYVLAGGRMIFKPVELLFEEAGYVLCRPAANSDGPPLALYDQVIVQGTDLQDGKIVG
jgi:hypothetical protein